MKISVLGCGRWGSFLAWYTAQHGHEVLLWGREGSERFNQLKQNRRNEYLELQPQIVLSNSLQESIETADMVLIAISAQQVRSLTEMISEYNMSNKVFVLCMKGLEAGSGKRLTQVFSESNNQNADVAVWLGPGHVQDFVRGIPNCMVVSSKNIELTKFVVDRLANKLIRFYYGDDLIGNEIGAAAKNVIGIASGMLDGLGISSLKGALMARGPREISRLISAMGGSEITAYGLCHLGDFEATLFSDFSQNRLFGEKYVKGEKFDKLAEGVSTIEALVNLSKQYHIDMPISNALYSIIYDNEEPELVLGNLFLRKIKVEF